MMISRCKSFTLAILACILTYGVYVYSLGEKDMPPVRDGDIIFQTSWVDQSLAIGLASMSLYIHSGIIRQTQEGPVVIEAAAHVQETPLHDWIQRGVLHRFALYRYKGLTPEQAARVLEAAKPYYGRAYDHYFSFGNKEIYCSELIYLSFHDAQIPVAGPQKVGDLYINNPFTKKLIEQRWRNYPSCKGRDITFDQCYGVIMAQEIVSPARIAADSHFERIFTNYR